VCRGTEAIQPGLTEREITMKVELTQNEIIITLPRLQSMPLSKSEKSRFVATTDGYAKTGCEVDGKEIKINVMAIIPAR
jgi:hypothetical protein